MKLVYIKWQDAYSNSGWLYGDAIKKWVDESYEGCIIEQVGWLYEENKKHIILVGRKDGLKDKEQGIGQLQKIPKTWILKRIDLTRHIKGAHEK